MISVFDRLILRKMYISQAGSTAGVKINIYIFIKSYTDDHVYLDA